MKGKVVIVTGARRGLGNATIEKFAQEGYNVVINDREDKALI